MATLFFAIISKSLDSGIFVISGGRRFVACSWEFERASFFGVKY